MWTEGDAVRLIEGAAELGVNLNAAQALQFGRLADLLEETNRSFNLTRIPPSDFVTLHFLDSLTIAAVAPKPNDAVLDVGTGAGFPGLALAIAWPEARFTLMDGTLKKLRFVESAAEAIGLANVKILHARAEDAANNRAYAGRFSFVTARAVAPLERLTGWTAPFAADDGLVVAYKSEDPAEDLKAARDISRRYGCSLDRIVKVAIPGTEIARSLIVLRKRVKRRG